MDRTNRPMRCVTQSNSILHQYQAASKRTLVGAVTVVMCSIAALGFGPASTAVEMVQEGLRHFHAGEFESAGRAFAEADVAKPDDLRIAFDQACVYSATGDAEKARELMQQAALSRDAYLAIRSHYNLGCLAAAQARSELGDKPAEATPEQRTQGLGLLAGAVGHFRDCLRLDSEHADSRHNLEVIRLWMKQMQALWEEHDRQKSREEMNLLQFLAMLDARQTELRSATRSLIKGPQSPKRRQVLGETEDAQRRLSDEIEPLKEKIRAELLHPQPAATPGPGSGNAPPAGNDQAIKAVEILTRLADESDQAMQKGADRISEGSHEEAVKSQTLVLDNFNRIYMVAAPFTNVLNRAVAEQQTLVDLSTAIHEPEADIASREEVNSQQSSARQETGMHTSDSANQNGHTPDADFPELARRQSRVGHWSRMLSLKARQELPQIESQEKSLSAAQSRQDDRSGKPHYPDAARKQLQALKESMTKALELAPHAKSMADEAAERLADKKFDDALPRQEETLELLKQIAEPLPKQNQSQQQPNQANKNKQNQDRSQQPQPEAAFKDRDLSRQQALSVLRRARERERKYRQTQKELQRYLASPVKVDRDW